MPLRALNTRRAICSKRDCLFFRRSHIQDFARSPFRSLNWRANARNRCNELSITMDTARARATLLNVMAARMQQLPTSYNMVAKRVQHVRFNNVGWYVGLEITCIYRSVTSKWNQWGKGEWNTCVEGENQSNEQNWSGSALSATLTDNDIRHYSGQNV